MAKFTCLTQKQKCSIHLQKADFFSGWPRPGAMEQKSPRTALSENHESFLRPILSKACAKISSESARVRKILELYEEAASLGSTCLQWKKAPHQTNNFIRDKEDVIAITGSAKDIFDSCQAIQISFIFLIVGSRPESKSDMFTSTEWKARQHEEEKPRNAKK